MAVYLLSLNMNEPEGNEGKSEKAHALTAEEGNLRPLTAQEIGQVTVWLVILLLGKCVSSWWEQ